MNTVVLLLIGIALAVLGYDLQERLAGTKKLEAWVVALIGVIFILSSLGFLTLP